MKLHNGYILYLFLILMTFARIIANRISPIFMYLNILIFILIFILYKIKFYQLNKSLVNYLLLMILLLIESFFYQKITYSYNNLYYIQFFGSQIIFFILFSLFLNINKFKIQFLELFLRYVIILIFLSVIIDYLLLKNGYLTLQPMYKPNLASYYSKPFGLFGQFSVNTVYIVISYLLLYSFNKRKTKILFLFVTITIIIEDSGTGYIAYLLLLFSIFYRFIIFRFLILPIAISAIIFMIMNNIVDKLSYQYFIILYKYYFMKIIFIYNKNIDNIFDILLGIDGNLIFPVDFGPLFMIAKIGLLYFILYGIIMLYMIYKAPNIFFRMAILILVLGNIHYPTLFYPLMNVLLPILLIYLINSYRVKTKKTILKTYKFRHKLKDNKCVQ